jgi:hypothetical protein
LFPFKFYFLPEREGRIRRGGRGEEKRREPLT